MLLVERFCSLLFKNELHKAGVGKKSRRISPLGVAVIGLLILAACTSAVADEVTSGSAGEADASGSALPFGIAYAIGSLSCTLPIFLVVVGGSLASQRLTDSLAQFVGYALGMGSILIAVTIGAALFRGIVARWLRRVVPYVHRTGALFLVGSGLHLVYYWFSITGSFA